MVDDSSNLRPEIPQIPRITDDMRLGADEYCFFLSVGGLWMILSGVKVNTNQPEKKMPFGFLDMAEHVVPLRGDKAQ